MWSLGLPFQSIGSEVIQHEAKASVRQDSLINTLLFSWDHRQGPGLSATLFCELFQLGTVLHCTLGPHPLSSWPLIVSLSILVHIARHLQCSIWLEMGSLLFGQGKLFWYYFNYYLFCRLFVWLEKKILDFLPFVMLLLNVSQCYLVKA